MNWTEVNIYTTTEGIEPVCGRLLNVGVTGFQIRDAKDFEDFLNDKTGNWDYIDDDLMNLKDCETCVTFYLADNSQGVDMLAMVRSEMAELAAMDSEKKFGRLATELSNVREEDWANNWKQYFKPLTVGDKLVIKPSWEKYDGNDSRTVLEIDPESSFGTGQHNTTQLCLELLEKCLNSCYKRNVFFYFLLSCLVCSYTLFCSKEGAEEGCDGDKTKYDESFCPCACVISEIFYQRQCECIDGKCSCCCKKVSENT